MSGLDQDHYRGNVLDEVETLRRKVESLERALPSEVKGSVRLDAKGAQLVAPPGEYRYLYWKRGEFGGQTIAYQTAGWHGGPTDDMYFVLNAYKGAGVSAGDAVLVLEAQDVDAGTVCHLTVDSTGQTSISPVFGQQVNSQMTVGLTINQYTNDDEALAIKSSTDVAHGGYQAEADTFFTVSKAEAAAGGAALRGYKDSDGVAGAAVSLVGFLDENADTTKSTAGRAIVETVGLETSSGALANTVADGNVFSVRTRRGGSYVTLFIVDEDGDLHRDGSLDNSFDAYDDALAVRDLAQGLARNWGDTIGFNFEALREMGVITGGDRERPFVSVKRLDALMMGAIGQLYDRCRGLEAALRQAQGVGTLEG